MSKQSGLVKKFQVEIGQHDKRTRYITKVYVLDMVTCALGRMGFREKRFRDFDRILAEVCKEYAVLMTKDEKDDKELVYSKACLDREIKQYVGSMFVPYDERYGG